jgi:hypothetical protein
VKGLVCRTGGLLIFGYVRHNSDPHVAQVCCSHCARRIIEELLCMIQFGEIHRALAFVFFVLALFVSAV